ncbi:hypothetical protein D5S17_34775 [Pseudonocardiaceae bacterium YIM PH 21723]|nr:hypothetical protein D5S17_34775 [Pseudonocardiaceae bacterium YIM PH 21723]
MPTARLLLVRCGCRTPADRHLYHERVTPVVLGELIRAAAGRAGLDSASLPGTVPVELVHDLDRSEYATPLALSIAGVTATAPLSLARRIADQLLDDPTFAQVDVAAPGFVNFRLTPGARAGLIRGLTRPELPPADSLPDLVNWPDRVATNPYYLVQLACARMHRLARHSAQIDVQAAPELLELAEHRCDVQVIRQLTQRLRPGPGLLARLSRVAEAVHAWADEPACSVVPVGHAAVQDGHRARLALVGPAITVLTAGCHALGIDAPERI